MGASTADSPPTPTPNVQAPEEGVRHRVAPIEIADGVMLGGLPSGGATTLLPLILGPCAVESEDGLLEAAEEVAAIVEALGQPALLKASFDKANRSSGSSFRGIGLERALAALADAKATTGLPTLTDVHEPAQCQTVAETVDVLQIPAFLCRQTDLIEAAARTGRAVNIKKGQFLAPDDMRKAVDKARATGNERVFVTERGYSFGYNNLVVDMRAFAALQSDGIPVVFDVTHSLQLPGGGVETGGARRFAEPLARAAVAAGADGVFLEVHPDPENALSDSTTQLPPGRALQLLESLLAVRRAVLPALRAVQVGAVEAVRA